MIHKGAFTVYETNFALPSFGVDTYDFDVYAINISMLANACAALAPPVSGALSSDVGRAAAPNADGSLRVAAGYGIIISSPWYNAPVQSTEYYARQTCGHTKTVRQIATPYATFDANGFSELPDTVPYRKTPYIVTNGGVVCEDALRGMYAPGVGIPIWTMTDTFPPELGRCTVVFVAGDNMSPVSSGGQVTIYGTYAKFVYFTPAFVKPILVVDLMSTAEPFVAAIIQSVSLTEAVIVFKDQNGAAVPFPGGRLAITGIMFVEQPWK